MIPNECHFIAGMKQNEEFLFAHYIAVKSTSVINNPDKINFYYSFEPHSKWWDLLKEIPNISFHKVEKPKFIGAKPIKKIQHASDKLRMEILYECGGCYFDLDTIAVRSYHHLLKKQTVLGWELRHGGRRLRICNAIMFTKPHSDFFKIWLDNYERRFRPDGWNSSSVFLPAFLAERHQDLLTVLNANSFFYPSWPHKEKIFKDTYDHIPEELISLHLWGSRSNEILQVEDYSWAEQNPHTLYGKLILNVLKKSQV